MDRPLLCYQQSRAQGPRRSALYVLEIEIEQSRAQTTPDHAGWSQGRAPGMTGSPEMAWPPVGKSAGTGSSVNRWFPRCGRVIP